MHHFFRLDAVKIADIVLIILVQTHEIIVQVIPPCIYNARLFLCHHWKTLDTAPDPLQESRLQRSTLDEQILQPNNKTLNLHTVF